MNYQIDSNDIFGPNVSNFSLFPIQATAVQWLIWKESKFLEPGQSKGFILADTMGLGKTRTVAALCECNIVDTSIYICPLSIIDQVLEEFLLICSNLNIYTIDKNDIIKCSFNRDKTDIIKLKNSEMITPFVLIVNKDKISTKKNIIDKFSYYRIILDEAHVVRNGESTKFYQSILNIKQPFEIVNKKKIIYGVKIGMTGTPIQNGINDLISLFRLLDQDCFKSRINFDNELRVKIRNDLFRRTEDNITESMKKIMCFPKFKPISTKIIMKLEDTKLSKQVETIQVDRLKELCLNDNRFRENLSEDQKAFIIARTLISGENARSDKESNLISIRGLISYPFDKHVFNVEYTGERFIKIDYAMQIIEDNYGESFIIFHSFDNIRDAMIEEFKVYEDYNIKQISGKTNLVNRVKTLKLCSDLINNDKPVILFLSLRSTSEGLNCQDFSNIIFTDQDSNPQIKNQAIRRCHRTGQTKQIRYWELQLEGLSNIFRKIDVDYRIEEIKSEKLPSEEIINEYNAAWYFRQYSYTNQNGIVETGVFFNDKFQNSKDYCSEGPTEID